MYEEIFNEVHLTVVELPLEFEEGLPLYRGLLKELPFITGEGISKKNMMRQLAEKYQIYQAEQLALQEEPEEEMTSTLLSAEDLLKYYDGETFDGFAFGEEVDKNE